MKHQINHRYTNTVLFECDVPDEIEIGATTRYALELATKEKINLGGAQLRKANLRGANLSAIYLIGADLSDADLSDANLIDANLGTTNFMHTNLRGAEIRNSYLGGANFGGANLRNANLSQSYLAGANFIGANFAGAQISGTDFNGAYLRDAILSGAYIGDVKLVGNRSIFQCCPIGSCEETLFAYITEKGILVTTDFIQEKPIHEFREKLIAKYGTNKHRREYEAAITFIEVYADIWTPSVTEELK